MTITEKIEFSNDIIKATLVLTKEKSEQDDSKQRLLSGILTVEKRENPNNTQAILPCLFGDTFNASDITKVIIKEGITELEANAFKNCINLEELELPNSLVTFGADAFIGCSNQKFNKVLYHGTLSDWLEINFISSTTQTEADGSIKTIYHYYSSPMTIANHLYLVNSANEAEFTELTKLDISYININRLKPYIFAGFSAVTEVLLPSSLETISNQAFWGCSGITEIVIPRSVNYISSCAFDDCYNLTDIYFCNNPDLYLGYAIFSSCGQEDTPLSLHFEGSELDFSTLSKNNNWDLQSVIKFVFGPVKYFGCTESGLCWQQSYNNEIAIVGYNKELLYKEPKENEPYNWELIQIGEGPAPERLPIYEYFLNINIPEEINECYVTQIKSYAFANCFKANIINIPKTVTKIEDYTFYGCGNLMIFNIVDNTYYTKVSLGSYIDIKNEYEYSYLIEKSGAIVRYCTGCPAKDFILTAQEIRGGAFADSLNLESLRISTSNIQFFENAFYNCENLKQVILTDEITLDAWAKCYFENQYANPLYYAKKLFSVDATDNLTELSNIALEVLPNDYAFYNCENLTTLTINLDENLSLLNNTDTDILYIVGYTKEETDQDGGTILYITTQSIGKFAFCGCKNLMSITLPSVVLVIQESAFLDCHNITEVNYQGEFITWCKSVFGNKYSNPLFYDINHGYNNKAQYEIVNKKSFNGGTSDNCWNKDPTRSLSLSGDDLISLTQIPDSTFFASATAENPVSISIGLLKNLLQARIIGEHAFENCIVSSEDSDIAITLTDNQYIGRSAFRATNITTIEINGKNITLDDFAFADLKSQGTLKITSNTENLVLNSGCFNNSHFGTVIIPARYLSKIDLSDCEDLTIIDDGTVLPATIFYQATQLKSLTFEVPTGIDFMAVEKLTSESFKYCKNFGELKLTDGAQTGLHYTIIKNCLITANGELIFGANNANIADINIENIPISIKDRAFAYRTFSTIPALPANTVAIGRDIFYNATIPTKS
ncbi:MAG: leucine-rich repeat protein [Lachnospiraceae bacterium]|nr:leucine-rich repeat protein [Lachnospiraceae bacterium]